MINAPRHCQSIVLDGRNWGKLFACKTKKRWICVSSGDVVQIWVVMVVFGDIDVNKRVKFEFSWVFQRGAYNRHNLWVFQVKKVEFFFFFFSNSKFTVFYFWTLSWKNHQLVLSHHIYPLSPSNVQYLVFHSLNILINMRLGTFSNCCGKFSLKNSTWTQAKHLSPFPKKILLSLPFHNSPFNHLSSYYGFKLPHIATIINQKRNRKTSNQNPLRQLHLQNWCCKDSDIIINSIAS